MNTITTPVAASFSLSVVLHSAVLAVLLLAVEQVTSSGQGVEIELIPSAQLAEQQETDIPKKHTQAENQQPQTAAETLTEKTANAEQKHDQIARAVLTSKNNMVSVTNKIDKKRQVEKSDHYHQQADSDGASASLLAQSTNAREQQQSILALLHATISNNKEYPYIARRQRREGTATVGFVLHPDGSIENARLLASSRAGMLDRAALSAVKRIEPFTAAHDYLEHAEEFRINVVFNLH